MKPLPVQKKLDEELPIPTIWRQTIANIVNTLQTNNIRTAVPNVEINDEDRVRVRANILAYGDSLINLPEQSWLTSIYVWSGKKWDVLVDLFTKHEGASDLVLFLEVTEKNAGFKFIVCDVHVP